MMIVLCFQSSQGWLNLQSKKMAVFQENSSLLARRSVHFESKAGVNSEPNETGGYKGCEYLQR